MKRGIAILLLGIAAATAAYACMFVFCTTEIRNLERTPQPELAWLKQEFQLGDSEFQRISELHADYLPVCAEMCRKIAAQRSKLDALLDGATNSSPEIEAAMNEGAALQAECQILMLRHFFQVSQTMPPEQGRRYMDWVKTTVFTSNHEMSRHH